MRRFGIIVAVVLLRPTIGGAQTSSAGSHGTSVGGAVGLVAEGRGDNSFAFDVHGAYDTWVTARLRLGAEAAILSALNNGCDEGCNAGTRAYGLLARGAIGIGTPRRARELRLGVGVGPFRARYSARSTVGGGGVTRVERTVPGVAADLTYVPMSGSRIRPMFSLRGLVLPDRDGIRARYVALGVGLTTR